MKKKPEYFCRRGTESSDKNELLDLCEEYGNQSDGVSSLFLGKRLTAAGIDSISKFMKCTTKDIYNFPNVGPKKAIWFIKMQSYQEHK